MLQFDYLWMVVLRGIGMSLILSFYIITMNALIGMFWFCQSASNPLLGRGSQFPSGKSLLSTCVWSRRGHSWVLCFPKSTNKWLSSWDLQEQGCWAPSVHGPVYWVQTPGSLSSFDFQCHPASSEFAYILPTISLPLVQVNRVHFFACERRMLYYLCN